MDVIQWVQANVTWVALGAFIVGAITPPIRDWVLRGFLGYILLQITQPSREADRRATAATESGREIREAVGNLEEGLAGDLINEPRARVQVNQSLSVLERRWPDLRDQMHNIVVAADGGNQIMFQDQRQLMRPFVERLRKELGEGP